MIGIFFAFLFFGATILLLAAILRFSVVSAARTRGAEARLRNPDVDGVAEVCEFALSADLSALFREAPFITRTEFALVDNHHSPPRRWEVGGFIPLTKRDVKEARLVHRVRDGIPIATDLTKGTYILCRDGRIVLRSAAGDKAVANSAVEFRTFTAEPP
jgi:hypothetical protein